MVAVQGSKRLTLHHVAAGQFSNVIFKGLSMRIELPTVEKYLSNQSGPSPGERMNIINYSVLNKIIFQQYPTSISKNL